MTDTDVQACHRVVSRACQCDGHVNGWRVPLQENCELHVSVLTISHNFATQSSVPVTT